MKISKITVGRLYNLGNYEHIRYDLTVDVPDGESASTAIIAVERLLVALSPIKNITWITPDELKRRRQEIEKMKKTPAIHWDREFGHSHSGAKSEIIQQLKNSLAEDEAKLQKIIDRSRQFLVRTERTEWELDDQIEITVFL